MSQKRFGDKRKREELEFWEIVGDLCESLHVCSRSCKKKEEKRLRLQVKGDLR